MVRASTRDTAYSAKAKVNLPCSQTLSLTFGLQNMVDMMAKLVQLLALGVAFLFAFNAMHTISAIKSSAFLLLYSWQNFYAIWYTCTLLWVNYTCIYYVVGLYTLLWRAGKVDSQFIVRDISKRHAGRRSFCIFYLLYTM